MPNNGTKIYTQTINGVRYGIDVEHDVYKVLGIGPINGFYDIAYACNNTHGKICQWSRFKPVRTGTFEELPREGFACPDKHWGFIIEHSTSLLKCYDGSNRSWTYLPPRVDVDWSRITDFDGYCHNAKPPCYGTFKYGEVIRLNAFLKPSLTVGVTSDADSTYAITLADFTNDLSTATLFVELYQLPVADIATPHDRSKWVRLGTYESEGMVSTGAGSVLLNFPLPQQVIDDDTRPFWIVAIGLRRSEGFYPIPYDNDHFWYGFVRPYFDAWFTSGPIQIGFGKKNSSGALTLTRPYSGWHPTFPAGWNGDVYVNAELWNKLDSEVTISRSGGLTRFRMLKVLRGSTATEWSTGQIVDSKGVAATTDMIISPSPSGVGRPYIKFPSAIDPSYKGPVTLIIQVSHNSGTSWTELIAETFTIS